MKKSDNADVAAKFSSDGKWILILHGKIEIWKIIKQGGQYRDSKEVESVDETFHPFSYSPSLSGVFSISSDGNKIAVLNR